MLPLALVSNPGPPQRNPVSFTGPSITFSPFNPFGTFSVDLMGASWKQGPKKNPPDASVVFNIFTEEARRYPGLNGPQAVEAAALSQGVAAPVQAVAGWARCGPWLARLGQVRINPEADFDAFTAHRPFYAWAYLTLDLIWASRQESVVSAHQVSRDRPVVRVNRNFFVEVYRHNSPGASDDSVFRSWERWKETSRQAGLERHDAYDSEHPSGDEAAARGGGTVGWFAIDLPLAYDYVWMILGNPHPLENLHLGGGPDVGQERAARLLHGLPRPMSETDLWELRHAAAWADEPASRVPELTEEEIEARKAAVRSGLDPDVVAPVPRIVPSADYKRRLMRGEDPRSDYLRYKSRVEAVRPAFEELQQRGAAQAAEASQLLPVPIEAEEEHYETPLERYRREYAAWKAGGGVGPQPQLPGGKVQVTKREKEDFTDPSHPWNQYVARKQEQWAREAAAAAKAPTVPAAVVQTGVTAYGGLDPAQAVRELYQRIGNQFDLARQLQTSQGLVNEWLTGKRRPMQQRTLTRIFDLYSRLIRPVTTGPLVARSASAYGSGRAVPSKAIKLTAGVRRWLLQQRDTYLANVSDLDVERAANLKVGWIARAREVANRRSVPGRLSAWRRFRDYLLSVVPADVSGVMPQFNPGPGMIAAQLPEPRRRNRDSKWKKPPEVTTVPREKFKWWGSAEDEELADKKYKRFHGTAGDKVKIFNIPDGKKEVTRDPVLHVALHETLETPYQVPWQSTKRGDDPKKPITWFHEHPKGGRPLEVLNPVTGVTSKIGGTYVVDDYWYS